MKMRKEFTLSAAMKKLPDQFTYLIIPVIKSFTEPLIIKGFQF